MGKEDSFLFFPGTNLSIAVYICLYRSAFVAGAELVSEDIIRMLSFCCQAVHSLFHCLSDIRLLTWDLFCPQPLHQAAVVCFDTGFFSCLTGADHVARHLVGTAQIRQHTAQIGTAVAIHNHAVLPLFQHIVEKGSADAHLVASQGKW